MQYKIKGWNIRSKLQLHNDGELKRICDLLSFLLCYVYDQTK